MIQEAKWHEIMEHNTLVQYGFKAGSLCLVPDPEEERNKKFHKGNAIFDESSQKKNKNKAVAVIPIVHLLKRKEKLRAVIILLL